MTLISHPFLLLIGIVLSLTIPAKAQFDFQEKEIKILYQNVICLKTDSVKKEIQLLKDSTEYVNGILPLVENYLDIITLLTTQDKELYKKLKPNENKRIKEVKPLDKNSPYYLFVQADIKLQWAFTELIFEDYINGFLDLKRANELVNRNMKKYPDFAPNFKVKGLIDLLTEAAPKEADLALFAAGLSRSSDGEKKLIKTAINEPIYKEEIGIYLAIVNTYIKGNTQLGLWNVERIYNANDNNLFAQFTYAGILNKLGKHQEIIDILGDNNLSHKKGYLYIPYLDYLLGEAYTYQLNFEKAKNNFELFLKMLFQCC